jgi:hypothetical protein
MTLLLLPLLLRLLPSCCWCDLQAAGLTSWGSRSPLSSSQRSNVYATSRHITIICQRLTRFPLLLLRMLLLMPLV